MRDLIFASYTQLTKKRSDALFFEYAVNRAMMGYPLLPGEGTSEELIALVTKEAQRRLRRQS